MVNPPPAPLAHTSGSVRRGIGRCPWWTAARVAILFACWTAVAEVPAAAQEPTPAEDTAPANDPRAFGVPEPITERPAPSYDPRDSVFPIFPPRPDNEPTIPPPLGSELPTELRTSRDVLLFFGVDASYLEMLQDGQPIGLDEEASLYKLLYASQRFPLVQFNKLGRREWNLNDITIDPSAVRGEAFLVRGYVTKVIEEQPLPEVISQFQLQKFYKCYFTLNDTDMPAIVYTTVAPKNWKLDEDIHERASAWGLFAKLEGNPRLDVTQSPTPIFIAPRIAWHPDSFLGRHGVDVGLLEAVMQRAPLMSQDREIFYQLLAAAPTMKLPELQAEAKATQERFAALARQENRPNTLSFQIGQLLDHPDNFRGDVLGFSGNVKRAINVRVPDGDVRRRFGIDHYYELQVFLDLEYLIKDDAGNERRFQNYPITVCVRQLPGGMPEGENLRVPVNVNGVFLKIWSYASQYAESQGDNKRQLAPLLVAPTVMLIQPEPRQGTSYAGWIAGGLFLLAIGGIWLGIWRYSRDDKKFRQFSQQHTGAGTAPDLSGLAEMEQRKN